MVFEQIRELEFEIAKEKKLGNNTTELRRKLEQDKNKVRSLLLQGKRRN